MRRTTRTLLLPLAGAAALAACSDNNPSTPPVDREACQDAGVEATYAGDVDLRVGQATELAAAGSLCLVLPDADREYALSYVDTRPIDAAETAQEPFVMDSFTVRLTEVGAAARARRLDVRGGPSRAVLPGGDYVPTFTEAPQAQAGTRPFQRATPWTAGESFTLFDNVAQADRPARVDRVYGGWLVIASFTDQAYPALERQLAQVDSGWPDLRDEGLPLLKSIFGDELPVTSAGSGQLLIFIRPLTGASGVAYGALVNDKAYSWIVITPNSANTTRTWVSLTSLVMHEVTHTFQRTYIDNTRPAGGQSTGAAGAARWGVEGGAAVMQNELVRRQAGHGFTANWDWREPVSLADQWYAVFAQAGDGTFSAGYGNSMAFMTDLVRRLEDDGMSHDAALREVLLGGAEGWHGWSWGGQRRRGLVSRMRDRFGNGWDPAEAMLTWTLAHALDDAVGGSTFQDRQFLRSWDVPPENPIGWHPHAVVSVGDGADVQAKRMHGSTGYFRIAGRGGVYHLRGGEGVRWMIARRE